MPSASGRAVDGVRIIRFVEGMNRNCRRVGVGGGGKTTSVTSLYSRARFTVSLQSRASPRRLDEM